VATTLQNMAEADKVALHIEGGVLNGVTYSGLGGEIDDGLRSPLGEELIHRVGIGNINPIESEGGMLEQLGQACLLEGDVVVAVEVIQSDNLLASREQSADQVEPDET